MKDDVLLLNKQADLKQQLEVGNYTTLPDKILDSIGRGICKLTRKTNKPSYGYSSVVLFIMIFVFGISLSYTSTRNHPYQREIIVILMIMISTASISMLVGKIFIDRIFKEFRNHVVDSLQTVDDLNDLRNWFGVVSNLKFQAICGILYTLIMPTIITFVFRANTPIGFIGVGTIIAMLIPFFQVGIFIYYLFIYLGLPGRLSHYKYKLYLNDPNSSNVVDHISQILTSGLFLFSISMAISTLSVSYMWIYYSAELRLISLAILWFPITVIFFLNQSSLANIVKEAKKRKLYEIQARIEKLEEEDDIAEKETIEAINRLMDYHDRVRDTKNSSLSIRSVLNFLNSLLLPLITALITQVGEGLFK